MCLPRFLSIKSFGNASFASADTGGMSSLLYHQAQLRFAFYKTIHMQDRYNRRWKFMRF
jgi:hypothetical protein